MILYDPGHRARDMLSSSFSGLLILIPGMGRLVGAGPPTAADVAEPPIMNGHGGYGGRGETQHGLAFDQILPVPVDFYLQRSKQVNGS